jgi:hypothetical protein
MPCDDFVPMNENTKVDISPSSIKHYTICIPRNIYLVFFYQTLQFQICFYENLSSYNLIYFRLFDFLSAIFWNGEKEKKLKNCINSKCVRVENKKFIHPRSVHDEL